MLVATHMLAASAIYKLCSVDHLPASKKAIALPIVLALSFGSHFALDAIPHDELQMGGNVAIGMAVILYLLYIAWRDKQLFILAAGFLGALPDIMWVLKISPKYDALHSSLHFSGAHVSPVLMLFEIIGMLLLTFLIYTKKA
ncbi:hypothetical protein ACFQI7_20145 [Paenibacillus allorhizosphaerae]|uniref:DUF1440 domain-containing protein n=1 Tax=Paenibacillus allorhizosphaerae TaxID=2849866 RepID=A0ABM8VKS2_9BACL|nr:hypothetical protein [Paenibacillus allorhizosphaerae]CAG7647402.1 hypothetical protein PAECIP111802_03966 [Paenibacillus allorhizosphaerae]